jgi:cell division control protein 11
MANQSVRLKEEQLRREEEKLREIELKVQREIQVKRQELLAKEDSLKVLEARLGELEFLLALSAAADGQRNNIPACRDPSSLLILNARFKTPYFTPILPCCLFFFSFTLACLYEHALRGLARFIPLETFHEKMHDFNVCRCTIPSWGSCD